MPLVFRKSREFLAVAQPSVSGDMRRFESAKGGGATTRDGGALPMLQIGLVLMVLASVLGILTLLRVPAALRREIGWLELVSPAAAATCLIFVGAGIAEFLPCIRHVLRPGSDQHFGRSRWAGLGGQPHGTACAE